MDETQPITRSYLANQAYFLLMQIGDVVTTEIALSQGITEKNQLWLPIVDLGPISFALIRIGVGISVMLGMEALRRKDINPNYILWGANLSMTLVVGGNVLGLMGILPTK